MFFYSVDTIIIDTEKYNIKDKKFLHHSRKKLYSFFSWLSSEKFENIFLKHLNKNYSEDLPNQIMENLYITNAIPDYIKEIINNSSSNNNDNYSFITSSLVRSYSGSFSNNNMSNLYKDIYNKSLNIFKNLASDRLELQPLILNHLEKIINDKNKSFDLLITYSKNYPNLYKILSYMANLKKSIDFNNIKDLKKMQEFLYLYDTFYMDYLYEIIGVNDQNIITIENRLKTLNLQDNIDINTLTADIHNIFKKILEEYIYVIIQNNNDNNSNNSMKNSIHIFSMISFIFTPWRYEIIPNLQKLVNFWKEKYDILLRDCSNDNVEHLGQLWINTKMHIILEILHCKYLNCVQIINKHYEKIDKLNMKKITEINEKIIIEVNNFHTDLKKQQISLIPQSNSKTIREINETIAEIKPIMRNSIKNVIGNIESTESLLKQSEKIKEESNNFQIQGKELKNISELSLARSILSGLIGLNLIYIILF